MLRTREEIAQEAFTSLFDLATFVSEEVRKGRDINEAIRSDKGKLYGFTNLQRLNDELHNL